MIYFLGIPFSSITQCNHKFSDLATDQVGWCNVLAYGERGCLIYQYYIKAIGEYVAAVVSYHELLDHNAQTRAKRKLRVKEL